MDDATITPLLRCPTCAATPLELAPADLRCPQCGTLYIRAGGRPVLLRAHHAVLEPAQYAWGPRGCRRRVRLPQPSVNLAQARAVGELGRRLPMEATVLLVGSGDQREKIKALLRRPDATVVSTDIDPGADVDLWADAHDLPFANGSFDAVVATAVLEHVLDPNRVVAELHRVLGPVGLIYTEAPFIQQVHEGSYDFTRWTHAGHRRLMRWFEEIDSGVVAGAGTALAWSLEHFVIVLAGGGTRRRTATKTVARLAFWWLSRLDGLLVSRPAALDAASCTYFLGRRATVPVGAASIIDGYRGAQAPPRQVARWSPSSR